jgi:hypothetical protein
MTEVRHKSIVYLVIAIVAFGLFSATGSTGKWADAVPMGSMNPAPTAWGWNQNGVSWKDAHSVPSLGMLYTMQLSEAGLWNGYDYAEVKYPYSG